MPSGEIADHCPNIQFQVASLVARQAYSLFLNALRCKGVSADSKLSVMLADIRKILSISEENHYCEVRRVLNDDKLTEIGNLHNKNQSNDLEKSWSTLLPNDRLEVSNILSSDLHCRRLADQFSVLINKHNRNLKRSKLEPILDDEILIKKQRKAFEHYTQATSESLVIKDKFKNVEKLVVPPCFVEPDLTLSASSIIEAHAPQVGKMDSIEVIGLVVKYLDFQQLCLAERINATFKFCVAAELRSLKCIDFIRIFTDPENYGQIFEKIYHYCSNLRKFDNFPPCWDHAEFNQSHVLHILKKFIQLEIDSDFEETFGLDAALTLIEQAPDLQQLYLNFEENRDRFDNESMEKICSIIAKREALTKLAIDCDDLWINLPLSCANLTCLNIDVNRKLEPQECAQLYQLFDVSRNLADLRIRCIEPDGLLLNKLLMLQNLKMLELDIECVGSNQNPIHCIKARDNLYLNALEQIFINFEGSESDHRFVSILLAHSPALKRCALTFSTEDLDFFKELCMIIPHPELIECFYLDNGIESICADYSRLIGLKHAHVCNYLQFENAQLIASLKNLKYLHLSSWATSMGKYYPETLETLCCSSLEGVLLNIVVYSVRDFLPDLIEIVMDNCPNLKYFSTTYFPGEQMRQLPEKLRNLQFLRICHYCCDEIKTHCEIICDEYTTEDLVYVVQNSPSLRLLAIHEAKYDALLKVHAIKEMCRQGKLSVISGLYSSWSPTLHQKWQEICSGTCCV